ncbi:GNAT family N-acetyltransferase [Pelagibius sp. CAU 1746]|uniref:GNAT family N-acetyltransferase n=1 Tax=Pelagibius sp. CAU 1746 TaxID=3140370 RepID=UPI00325BDCFB
METCRTERLILRPRGPADFEACLEMDSDPEVIRYVGPPWSNEEEHRDFLRRRIEARYPPGLGYWSIFAKDDPTRFLGWVMLHPYSVAGAEVEIGWRLRRDAWGRGYATEAAAPVLAQGFAKADMTGIVADIHPDNHGSIRVAEKIGLSFTGMVDHDGEAARRYGIDRATFAARRAAAGAQPNSK